MHLTGNYRYCPHCGVSWEIDDSCLKIGNHIRCKVCDFILYKAPKVAVCAVVEIGGKIIMIRRKLVTDTGEWAIPGGFVDAGETLESAAVREFKEEALIDITIKKPIGVYSYVNNPVILIVFQGSTNNPVPGCGDEATEVALFDYEHIPWENLAFAANRDALRDYYQLKDGDKT